MSTVSDEHARVAPPAENARYWNHPAIADVELLRARFVHHRFARHTHPTYTLALIERGVEEYLYRGETRQATPGDIGVIEPDTLHTGHAGVPDGWEYRVMYPSEPFVRDIARAEGVAGAPRFPDEPLQQSEAAHHLRRAHIAAELGDDLSASSLLRIAIAYLVRGYSLPGARGRAIQADGPASVQRAEEILRQRLVSPPSLEELATLVGSAPHPLLRAFRRHFGLPPHAYLNQFRVIRARTLLAGGQSPADVAHLVGFADQSHLTRHFKRHTGVGPGAYRRGFSPQ